MNPLLHSSSFLFLTIVIASVGISSSFRVLKDEAKFEVCSRLFECGNRTLGYPFWGGDRIQDCGLPDLKLECQNNTYPQVGIDSRNFYILDIREMDQILTVVAADMVDDGCPERIVNTTIDDSPFECASNNAKLTYVYNCSNGIPSLVPSELRCARRIEPVYDGYYTLRPWVRENHSCSSGISIPLLGKYYTDLTSGFLTATDALKKGFDLKYKRDYSQIACWECLESSGQCGFDRTSQEFVCFSHQDHLVGAADPYFETCTVPRSCGNQTISFPFYIQGEQEHYCGYPGFNLSCDPNGRSILNLSGQNYVVRQIFYQNQSLLVSTAAFSDLRDERECVPPVRNFTPTPDFKLPANQASVVLLYNCRSSSLGAALSKYRIGCSAVNDSNSVLAFYENDRDGLANASRTCGTERVVAKAAAAAAAEEVGYRDGSSVNGGAVMREVLRRGFMLNWIASDCSRCESTKGRCGFNWDSHLFQCYCPDRPHAARCDMPASVVSTDPSYVACKPRNCGSGPNISYPFYVEGAGADFCGLKGFRIICQESTPIFRTSRGPYIVTNISYENQSVRLVDLDVVNVSANCVIPGHYFAFDESPFDFSSSHVNLQFFYSCNKSFTPTLETSLVACASNSSRLSFVALVPNDGSLSGNHEMSNQYCGSEVAVPVDLEGYWKSNKTIKTVNYTELLMAGFSLVWYGDTCANCKTSGGRCGFQNNQSLCFCLDGPHPTHCGGNKLGLKLGLGIGLPSLAVTCLIVIFLSRHYLRKRASKLLQRNVSDSYINSDTEEGSDYLGVLVFSYKDLQEATNNFNAEKELGDGGFGTVYHGKLKDGREVAVKRLYEHNYKRVEQFINEIEILTRLRHKNLVSLYGCTSRRCRELLLVYEYIPNGTVADHLHGDRAKTGPLSWPVRMSIAIETASALAYLHASDIVHRDVKTNNILLDNNFCVKVADFGLSRLFPNDVTHVSTAPQGTPGYVDPEYHQCYQLTSKSDVYSFGVVLVELISSMPAVDITRHRHEINLSNLALSKIQKRAYSELVDPCLGFDTDIEVKTMIIAVAELAFQCLQQDKEMRPSMDEVLESLKAIEIGNNESENHQKEEAFDGSGLSMSTVPPPPSPDCDEVVLLKRMKQEHPPSPNTVTEHWPSSRSTTPNISG